MRRVLPLLLLLTVAGVAAAVDVFPNTPAQTPIAKGMVRKVVTGGCATIPCTGPQFHFFASDTPALMTECSGTGRVLILCQAPNWTGPLTIGDSGSLTNNRSVVAVDSACPWARAQISECGSGTCDCRAWLLQLHGDF